MPKAFLPIAFIAVLSVLFSGCNSKKDAQKDDNLGTFIGTIEYGNFSDEITIDIEKDSLGLKAYFTSLGQNAYKIPFQDVTQNGDTISFSLQSDFYKYQFTNIFSNSSGKLIGILKVNSIEVPYQLNRLVSSENEPRMSNEVEFINDSLKHYGTVWYPKEPNGKAIVIVTSSGNADRSASRAQAILLARRGFTTFHYDKRGTGQSPGNWGIATMDELINDDIAAIEFFAKKEEFDQNSIGIIGSSQGGTKIPCLLSEMPGLGFGISVSCPGGTLLKSDINYWKNRKREVLGQNLELAADIQEAVFEYIAKSKSKDDLLKVLDASRYEEWFDKVWIPNLEEVQFDTKLNYNPLPHFEKTTQPILLIQGTKDEIIPENSYQIISEASAKNGKTNVEVSLLKNANHSMYAIVESDFPYWATLHPDYLNEITNWINSLE
ncbi:MAG: prolyl oligopeptidase family serine peptidase [Bacteroidia bacterium]